MQLKFCIAVIATSFALTSCSEQREPEPPTAAPSADTTSGSVPTQVNSMSDYEAIEKAALSGDYQAQRNLAYTLTTSIPRNPILGCAWRIVIIESGSPDVDQSDTGNRAFDCGKLSVDELSAAQAQAKSLQAKIAGK